MTFRIFTNDRGKQRGVLMYSAYKQIQASTAAEAESKIDTLLGGRSRLLNGPLRLPCQRLGS